MFISLLKDLVKDTDEHADGKGAQGKVCGEGCGASIASLLPLSQNFHVFTNPEAL